MSRNVKFGTVESLVDKTADTIVKALMKVVAVYRKRGLTVTTLLMDGEFRSIRPAVHDEIGAELNIVSRDEHVPEIECYIRVAWHP